MARKRALQPANPIHPGAMLLEEFLQPAEKSQAAFAREIGWTKARLNEFIRNNQTVIFKSLQGAFESFNAGSPLK